MSKYPFVYLMREKKDSYIDKMFEDNKKQLECIVEIISPEEKEKLNKFSPFGVHTRTFHKKYANLKMLCIEFNTEKL